MPPMDFRLPAEVAEWKARMRAFVERELVPLETELPPFRSALPPERVAAIVARLKAEGLWALAVPREYGGAGLGLVGLCALRESLGQTTLFSLARLLGTEPPILLYDADEAQKRRYLLPAIRGEITGCFALTEPDAGSDAAALRLRAEPDGGGQYVLNGHKIFSSHADEADFALVFGVTPPPDGGITMFLVDTDAPGLRLVRQIDTMGGDRPSELIFEDCRVPASSVVGRPGQAFALAQKWFTCDRIALQPPIALGAAGRSLRLAVDAGVAPAAELGALALRLDAARQMVYHAAWKADRGLDARHEASMVKATATTLGVEIVDRVMQWFGPDGYGRDLPFERYYRDLRRFPIAAGTYEIQQFVVARALLRGYARLNCLGGEA
jgi:acyl-CoA dehydrogenase